MSPCDRYDLIVLHTLFSLALGYFVWIEHHELEMIPSWDDDFII